MTTKLPEGVPVFIDTENKVCNCWLFDELEQINGTALTHEQLAERDKAIARAAFLAARREVTDEARGLYDSWDYQSADDYLQSEEFKKLVGEK